MNLTPTQLADLERRLAAALPEYGAMRYMTRDPDMVEITYHAILGRAIAACWAAGVGVDSQPGFVRVRVERGDYCWVGSTRGPDLLTALVAALEQRANTKETTK